MVFEKAAVSFLLKLQKEEAFEHYGASTLIALLPLDYYFGQEGLAWGRKKLLQLEEAVAGRTTPQMKDYLAEAASLVVDPPQGTQLASLFGPWPSSAAPHPTAHYREQPSSAAYRKPLDYLLLAALFLTLPSQEEARRVQEALLSWDEVTLSQCYLLLQGDGASLQEALALGPLSWTLPLLAAS